MTHQGPTVKQSLQEYARGVIGGLLFSLPLLYTMEVWWHGFIAGPGQILAALAVTFGLLLGYNRYAGLRASSSFSEVAIDSVEELGLGLLVAALLLWLLRRITTDMSWHEVLGKVAVETLAVAIGVSVGTAQLGSSDDQGMGDAASAEQGAGQSDSDAAEPDTLANEETLLGQMTLALCGSMLLAANVAPTEEIIQLAFESTPGRLLTLVALSLGLAAIILFFSDFNSAPQQRDTGRVGQIVQSTVITYAVALVASAASLWFFNRLGGLAPGVALAEVVVLGLASTLGASAGRLLLQSS